MSRLPELQQSIQFFNLNLEGLQPQPPERRQIHLHDQVSTAVSKTHTESRHVQTDEMNTETLKRLKNLINGPHSAAFCKNNGYFNNWI